MIRNLEDVSYGSAAVVPGAGAAFQSGPNIEGFDTYVNDSRASGSTALGVGTLWVENFLAANTGDAAYSPSAIAGQAIPLMSYGVLTGIPIASAPVANAPLAPGTTTGGGNQLRIRQKGSCLANCTTGTRAIAVGDPLIADGSGNLTTAAAALTAPSGGTATPYGTTGAATVTYQVYARNANGRDSAASANITTTTANATLSVTNGVLVSATVPAGTSSVVVVRTVGGASQGVISVKALNPGATSFTVQDYGQAAEGAYSAPTTSTFAPGVVLAIAKGTLAASQAATPILVTVGGY